MADGIFDRRKGEKDTELEIQGALFNVHRPCCLLRRGRWETLLNDNLQVSVPYYGTVYQVSCMQYGKVHRGVNVSLLLVHRGEW